MRLLIITGLFLILSSAHAEKPDGILAWDNDEADKDYKILSKYPDGICNPRQLIAITKMPKPEKARKMGLEIVMEYSNGEIITEWVIPIESTVLAVNGRKIIAANATGTLQIHEDGNFEITKELKSNAERLKSCPDFLLKIHGNTSDLGCYKYEDKSTNKPRYIAYYEGPCT